MNRILLCILVFLSVIKTFAQQQDTLDNDNRLKVFPLPVVYYTPETKLAFGAVGLFSFRFKDEPKSSRNSQFQIGAAYTLENQLLFYTPFQLYLNNEKYYFFGETGYYRYSYKFFGVGNNIPEEYEELYKVNFPRIRLNALQLVRPSLYLGIRYWFDSYDIVDTENGGILNQNETVGSRGGIVSSLGLISLYDSRDNYNYPTEGTYLEVLALPNLHAFGSDFEFTRFSVDYVKYFSKEKNIIAINLYGVSTLGEAPFNELAFIGGRRKMRGYYEGRFRDRNLLMAQAEYRRKLFWRVGMVAFGGYGVVARDFDKFEAQNIRPSGGLGLRYELDKKENINIRLDFGFGENGSAGTYLTFGEAF